MFVRIRKIKLKNGEISEIYQAVKSYRRNGKVKQKVVALGKHTSVQDALVETERIIARIERNLQVPLDKYRAKPHWAKKIRARLERDYKRFKEKHRELIYIEQDNIFDTTKIGKGRSNERCNSLNSKQ